MSKIAILELDIKYCKMIFGYTTEEGLLSVDDEFVENLRIYKDIEIDGVIKPVRTLECIKTIQNFKKTMEFYNIDTFISYATQSFRNAKNQKSFLDEITNSTSFHWDILSDNDVNNSIHLLNFYTIEQHKAIVINIDAYKINLLKYNRRNLLANFCLNFGAVNIAEEVANLEKTPTEKMKLMVESAKEKLKDCAFICEQDLVDFKLIGMGTTFTNLSKMCRLGTKYSLPYDHTYELSKVNFDKTFSIIECLDADKTKRIKGISEDRADIVASGSAIIKAMSTVFGIENIVINAQNLINGVLFTHINPALAEKNVTDILALSLRASNYFHDTKENDCTAIYNFSNDLFEELRVLHRFGKKEQKILKVASYFALCGKRISSINYERNSFNIVLNSDIYGVTQKELLLASFICASQNIDEFDFSNWVRYKDILVDEDLDKLRKLAVIVKMAKLIDKSKTCDHIVCDILGDNVIVSLVAKPNMVSQLEEVKKATNDFKKAYGKNLQVL